MSRKKKKNRIYNNNKTKKQVNIKQNCKESSNKKKKAEQKKQEENKNMWLIEIKKPRNLQKVKKENKALKKFLDILFIILKILFKITAIVVIYTVVFGTVMYFSNKVMVNRLRESEKNKNKDPVLTIIKEDKKVKYKNIKFNHYYDELREDLKKNKDKIEKEKPEEAETKKENKE